MARIQESAAAFIRNYVEYCVDNVLFHCIVSHRYTSFHMVLDDTPVTIIANVTVYGLTSTRYNIIIGSLNRLKRIGRSCLTHSSSAIVWSSNSNTDRYIAGSIKARLLMSRKSIHHVLLVGQAFKEQLAQKA